MLQLYPLETENKTIFFVRMKTSHFYFLENQIKF